MKKIIGKTTSSTSILEMSDIKTHLKIELSDTSSDDVLEIYKVAAISLIEKYCQIDIFSTIVEEVFPYARTQYFLEQVPVTAVNSIKYYDANNVQQTIANTNYMSYLPTNTGAVITIKNTYVWPEIFCRPDAVTINYSTGLVSLPPLLKAACLLQIGTFYENRENESEVKLSSLEIGVTKILDLHRNFTY